MSGDQNEADSQQMLWARSYRADAVRARAEGSFACADEYDQAAAELEAEAMQLSATPQTSV